jgi:hypothetical protein
MLHHQIFKHNIIKNKNYPMIIPPSPNITPTTINLPSMNLSQDFLQMTSFLRPFRHHTTGHNNIYMVSDTVQPSAQHQEPMLSILLNSNLIKGISLWWFRHLNLLIWKNHAWMRDEIKPSNVFLFRLIALQCTVTQLLRSQRMIKMVLKAVGEIH